MQQVENPFDLSSHEWSKLLRQVWGAQLSNRSLSPLSDSIILYKMIICFPSNGFEETIWKCLLAQHTQNVENMKEFDTDP